MQSTHKTTKHGGCNLERLLMTLIRFFFVGFKGLRFIFIEFYYVFYALYIVLSVFDFNKHHSNLILFSLYYKC